MAVYPDWVLAHKKKGMYINKVGDKYYLYATHSERIKGPNKVKRICDVHLGRITEKDGLISPKEKVKDTFITYEFGFSFIIISSTQKMHTGLRITIVKYGDFIYTASILTYMHGYYNNELFQFSYLCFHFPNLEFPENLTDTQTSGIVRGCRMIAYTMNKHFGDDLSLVKAYLSSINLIRINGKLYCSSISGTVKFSVKYHL
jgi:hypothetical protein